ncbi:MAG: L,D-transpeptidase family protein [Sphingomonas bacterium]|nr:L,D-transpeptidase family protein [Sphingomonas bacterium]
MILSIRPAIAAAALVTTALGSSVFAHPSVQAANASIDKSASSIADSETELRHAYDKAGWQPIWSSQSRQSLETALADRAKHGLDRVEFLPTDVNKGSPETVDVAYTRAALGYADALAHGHVDPKTLHEIYTVAKPNADLGAALAIAAKEGRVGEWLDGLAPQSDAYRALSDAYLAMRAKQDQTAREIAPAKSIHIGDTDPRVDAIAKQLADDGYLRAASMASDKYTQTIADAVKALQRNYGIVDDGIVGPDTLGVLNVDPADRARALAVALERRRWLSRTPPSTRIDVNTAAAMLRYYRDGKLVDERRVIVGEPDHETPSLGSPIYRLVANPTWTVPKSIQNSELANVGPSYMRAHNMRIENGWIVQQPGPDNALGLVKFDMKNDQAIYLHDTSSPSLFDKSERHLSHGCVRVSDALGFAGMIADQEGVGEQWREAHASGDYTIVNLPKEIPVRLLYHNVFVTQTGKLAYRTDPYGWNDAIATKLGFGASGNNRAKAQSVDVGP